MNDLVASNALLKTTATDLMVFLNNGTFLGLYTNPLSPSPAHVLGDFAEANFGGYRRQPINFTFPPPRKQQDGEYESTGPEFTFTCNANPSNLVYGWYLSNGTDVLLSAPFTMPIPVNVGTTFTVQIEVTVWATFTLVG